MVDHVVVSLEDAWSGGGVGRGQVPEPDRSVLGGGGEPLAVGCEGDLTDFGVIRDEYPRTGVNIEGQDQGLLTNGQARRVDVFFQVQERPDGFLREQQGELGLLLVDLD